MVSIQIETIQIAKKIVYFLSFGQKPIANILAYSNSLKTA